MFADSSSWLRAAPDAHTNVTVVCNTCQKECQVLVCNIVQQKQSIRCNCSATVRFASSERILEIKNALALKRLKPIGDFGKLLNHPTQWEMAGLTRDSYIDAVCVDCDGQVNKTCISSLLHTSTKGCDCRAKSEARMIGIISENAPKDVDVIRQHSVGIGHRGRELKVDCAVLREGNILIVFECDGQQHFENSFHATDDQHDRNMQNDLTKEKLAVEKGVVFVRVLQKHLWRPIGNSKRDSVEAFIVSTLEMACNGSIPPGVYTQDTKEYNTGKYYEMRRTDHRTLDALLP